MFGKLSAIEQISEARASKGHTLTHPASMYLPFNPLTFQCLCTNSSLTNNIRLWCLPVTLKHMSYYIVRNYRERKQHNKEYENKTSVNAPMYVPQNQRIHRTRNRTTQHNRGNPNKKRSGRRYAATVVRTRTDPQTYQQVSTEQTPKL